MVELISQKPKISLPAWRWPLWSSIILVLLSAAAFISLKVYLAQIQTDIADINSQIKAEAAKVNAGDETAMLGLNDSLGAFSGLIANHSYFSSALETIGALTNTKVVFTKFDSDREKGIMQLRGTAQNYTVLAKQIVALRENKNFKSMEIKGINFTVNGLEFELLADVAPELFIKK